MVIIAGLGNPEKRYEQTRHNVGFVCVDVLAQRVGARFSRAAHKASVASATIEGHKALLMKPSTYMNLSGESIIRAVKYYKVDPAKQLIVLYDDIDLGVGDIRIRAQGSAGTHNGMRSILYHLQTEKFTRIRIGIGRPPAGYDLAGYVLERPGADEGKLLSTAVDNAVDAVLTILSDGIEAAQQKYN